jgi:hypothetical protein
MARLWCAAGLVLVLASPANAQYSGSIGFHFSRNDALPTEPHLGGISLSSYAGPLGVRLNGGLHLTEREPNSYRHKTRLGVGAWTADADLVLAPFRSFGGFSPYGFAGIGGQGVRFPDLPDSSLATWSYGGGLSLQLAGPLAIDGDARYRRPLDGDRILPGGFSHDWEYRVGLTIGFGSSRRRGYHQRTPSRVHSVDSRRPARVTTVRVLPSAVVSSGERYVGTRYRYGGATPADGFDCSGFVQFVYGRHGVRLERTARLMSVQGERIALRERDLRSGDLMFFADDGSRVDHVALYVGRGRILHSTASGGGVRYDDLDSPRGRWFMERWVEARRVVDGEGSLVRDFARPQQVEDRDLDPPDRAPLPPSGE